MHPDQIGFIKGRQLYHNLHCLFNIVYSEHSTQLPEIVISLDAHKVHKISLYADDLLLFISDPENSIPKCLDTISQFILASGYKINLTKSVLFPINRKALTMSFDSCEFRVTTGPLTYLGVKVTRHYKDLLKLNFRPLIDQARK